MLDLDLSVVWVMLLVGLLAYLANRLFFRPVGQIVFSREQKATAEEAEIEHLSTRLQDGLAKVDQTLVEARREAGRIRESFLEKAESHREKVLAQARSEAVRHLEARTAAMEQELEGVQVRLQSEVGTFVALLKRKFVS